jgi:NOL1/NOP2/fmu family ribosome biogenesis protein
MLDLCAAPGGKSTHALSLLPEGSLLVSNDVIRSRADILVENTTKWGYPNVIVTNNDASDFKRLTHFFDVVSVDAPCSGEGLFRKDPESVNQWSLNNISLCKERQQRILRDIWPCLKPGGLLIYSTCTYNTKENEENIERLLNTFDAEILPIRHEKTWNISTPVHPNIYRFFPHKVAGEGFSLALIRKNDEESRHPIRIKTSPDKKQSPVVPDIKDRLIHPEKFRFSVKNNIITAFPEEIIPLYETIRSMFKIISAGITLAEIKGKDLSPSQSSATSIYLNKNKFETIEIGYKQALHYLCKEMLVLPPETPVSHLLVNYKNHPLGFVKNIGNRANNLYPQDWRIRTRYLPEEETIVINTDSQEPALP